MTSLPERVAQAAECVPLHHSVVQSDADVKQIGKNSKRGNPASDSRTGSNITPSGDSASRKRNVTLLRNRPITGLMDLQDVADFLRCRPEQAKRILAKLSVPSIQLPGERRRKWYRDTLVKYIHKCEFDPAKCIERIRNRGGNQGVGQTFTR